LGDVNHVSNQGKAVETELGNICLQKNVDLQCGRDQQGDELLAGEHTRNLEQPLYLGGWLIEVLLDGDGDTLSKLLKLKLLLLTHAKVLLAGECVMSDKEGHVGRS
jgi:hypothetical protein